jgi:hypothetical protein
VNCRQPTWIAVTYDFEAHLTCSLAPRQSAFACPACFRLSRSSPFAGVCAAKALRLGACLNSGLPKPEPPKLERIATSTRCLNLYCGQRERPDTRATPLRRVSGKLIFSARLPHRLRAHVCSAASRTAAVGFLAHFSTAAMSSSASALLDAAFPPNDIRNAKHKPTFRDQPGVDECIGDDVLIERQRCSRRFQVAVRMLAGA